MGENNNEKGIAHMILLLVMLVAIPVVLFLVLNPTNFFSRAGTPLTAPIPPDPPYEGSMGIIANHSFELLQDNAVRDWRLAGESDPSVDKPLSNYRHSGDRAFRIQGQEGVVKRLAQDADVNFQRGSTIYASGWMRLNRNQAKNIKGTVSLEVITFDAEDNTERYILNFPTNKTKEWVNVSEEIVLRRDAVKLRTRLRVDGNTGPVHLDDIVVGLVPQESP